MTEEKPRAPRARKKTSETDAAAKPAAKKKTAVAASRPRKRTVAAVQTEDVAVLAYLLWEQGEPGDADEHWLRAEHELAAA